MENQQDVLMPKTTSVPQITLHMTPAEALAHMPDHNTLRAKNAQEIETMVEAINANAKALIWAAVKAGQAHHDLDKLIDQKIINQWICHRPDWVEANLGFTIVTHDCTGAPVHVVYDFVVAATRD